MSKYIFPAVFTPEQSGYSVSFPDIDGCITCGDSLEESLDMAGDALSLMLVQLEDDKTAIPTPTEASAIKLKKGEFTSLISVDTMLYRRLLRNMAVKKTLSIPQWLNESALAAGLNFSQVLQDGLKRELNIV